MRHASVLLVLVVLAGCAGTLHDRLDLGDGLSIQPGMTGHQVEGVLGQPDTVTHDRRCLYARRFWWQSPSADGKTEWAWTDRDPVVVVWLKRDRVVGMGTVPRDRTFPRPYAAETLQDSVKICADPFSTGFPWFGNPGEQPFWHEERVRRRY